MIVVEGMDGAGKTSIASILGEWLGWPVVHAGGPPKDEEYVMRWMQTCLDRTRENVIQDRVTQISETVYGTVSNRSHLAGLALYGLGPMMASGAIFVCCRPPTAVILDNLRRHSAKAWDTPEHVAMVKMQSMRLIELYDTLFATLRRGNRAIMFDYTVDAAGDDLKWTLYNAIPFKDRPIELRRPR